MYFLSAFIEKKLDVLVDPRSASAPDSNSERLGDYCVLCGHGLAEHDQNCRGCGGIQSYVSASQLRDARGRKAAKDSGALHDVELEHEPPTVAWESPLVLAAVDDEEVRRAIGSDFNLRNSRGETPLMWAVRQNRLELTQWLLKQGADPNNRTASSLSGPKVRQGLYADVESAPGQTPLIWAMKLIQPDLGSLLLENGADPNLADGWGQSPLIWAALGNHKSLVEKLIARGGNLNHCDDIGMSPLLASVKSNRLTITLMLRKLGADASHRVFAEFGGWTLLHVAAIYGGKRVLAICAADADLDAFDSQLATPLVAAIGQLFMSPTRGRLARIEQLIGYGADADARGGDAAPTALWAACWLGNRNHSECVVNQVLEAGADPNLPGLFREPPLLCAARRANTAVVRRLLEAGADPRGVDDRETTALDVANQMHNTELALLLKSVTGGS